MKKATIELNGKFYDAKTGSPIGHQNQQKSHVAADSPFKSFDGVQKHAERRQEHSSYVPKQNLQRASTLNRRIVKKPQTSSVAKREVIEQQATETAHKILGVEPQARLERAKSVKPSRFIQKFHYKPTHIEPKLEKLEVIKAPEIQRHQEHAREQAVGGSAIEHFVQSQLASAKSHEQAFEKKARGVRHHVSRSLGVSRRTAGIITGAFALTLLTGFFAYQNIPNFAIRVAAKRAGFAASLPGYKPSGFAMNGPIEYSQGKISLSFAANADKDRTFKVSQQTSNWDSEALLNNVIVATNKPYQTYHEDGLTIYLYDDNSATWVNNGIWYSVEGTKANLSTEQLVKLATSM